MDTCIHEKVPTARPLLPSNCSSEASSAKDHSSRTTVDINPFWLSSFPHSSSFIAGVVIAAGSIPFIATQTIPTAIAVVRFPENLASNLGVLNIFCVSAQLFDTLYTGLVARFLGESFVMRIGAVWALAAGIAAFVFL